MAEAYQQNGASVPLFRPVDMKGFWLDPGSALRVSKEFEAQHQKARVVPGNIVIAAAGTVAKAARVPADIEFGAINGSCARVVVAKEVEGYVLAYLNSRYGFLSLMRWAVGSVQKHLNLEDFPRVAVPWPDHRVMSYIGDKVCQAELLRARASQLLSSATRLVDQLVDREISEDEVANGGIDTRRIRSTQQQQNFLRTMHTRTRCTELTDRIDAWHYKPDLVAACNRIKQSGFCQTLADVIDADRDIKGGATPLGAEYLMKGTVRFFRTSDVGGLAVSNAETVFITAEQDREMARSRLADGDVLLTITGADFGHAGAITRRHLPGNISQHSVRFRPKVDESYLVAYLESTYGQKVIWRQAYGATRPAIDYPGVKSLLIRVPNPTVQRVIGDVVRSGVMARDFAVSLTTAAKVLAEELIEGRVSETELKAAQANREADQALLRQLTAKGLNVADEIPLFPDLDALYAAIEESQRTGTGKGGVA